MKAASFVIGILVGMVLLVVAVGGGLAVALSVVTVGQIEDTVGTDIIDDASDANGQSLLDLAMLLMDDLADPSGITINLFREKYGLKLPEEISGIDISVLFDYPISEVADHLGDVVNNMTLRDVDEFLSLGLEEKYPDLSVLISNLDNNVDDALNNILASIDSSSMTLYSLETGFGITLGENRLFDELYHTPLNAFGKVMDHLPVGTLTGADSDLFLPLGENKVFVAVDRYEEVTGNELEPVADGEETYIAETYIAGADDKGLIRRELRYTRGEDGSYTPDNSCYAEDYDGTGTFYRHIVYEPYDGTQKGELSVKAYLNNFTADGKGLVADGLFPLSSVYTDESLSVSLAETVTGGKVPVGEDVFINIAADVFINIAAEGEAASPAPAALFGLPEGATKDENSRLEEQKADSAYSMPHIRVHIGTSDQAIQVIAGIGVSSLNNVTDKITSLKLGEVIDITDDSAKILRTLKDTQISKLSDALDTITLKDATDIVLDEYSPATDGAYVLEDGSYTLYNPAKHAGAQRYQKTVVEGSSSAALQRLANVTIPNISAAFDTMVLGDAIGVIPDAYILVDSPESGETYYVFNELGYPERAVYGVDEADAWYERVSSGEGNAILKQLAFVGINDISEAMNGVIEDTLLSDIIEIVRETAVKADEAGENWLVAYDPYLTAESADGEEIRYAFVYDGSGSYFRTSYLYTPATDALLPEGETMYFVYEEITDASDLVADQTAVQNVFFRSADGKYYDNPALAAYYAATNTDPSTWTNKPYKRVAANLGDPGAESATVYPNGGSGSGLYIEFFAAYVRYDGNNPAHWGRELFFKFTDGYTLSTADTKDETLYYYDFESGAYTSSQSASTSDALVMMTGRDDGKYYFSEINGVRAADDKAFASGDTVYSKRLAEVIYKLADDGSFVYEDGGYVAYDPDRHADVTERYDRVTGVLVNKAGNDGGEGLLAPLSTDRVSVVREKSSSVLIAMLDRRLTIGTLDENIKSFTIEELIDIESGSVFDDPTIKKATVDTLSDAITAKLTNSSIGELIRWANVRGVDEKVLFILEDVKISDFFTALEYKDGTITVNMEKLLGVN